MDKEKLARYLKSAARHPDRALIAAASEISRRPVRVNFSLNGAGEAVGMLPDSVARYMYLMDGCIDYEPETTLAIDRIVGPGSQVMVIGAHIGVHAIMAKKKAGESGVVVGFEPTPETYSLLVENCQHRGIMTEHLAINDGTNNSVEMVIFDVRHSAWNSASGARTKVADKWKPETISVEATSIDKYCVATGLEPDVLILDLENGERAALEGARQTIDVFRPSIVIECGDMGRGQSNCTRACLKLLSDWGYELYDPKPETGRFDKHEIQDSYPEDYPNILAVHPSKGIRL